MFEFQLPRASLVVPAGNRWAVDRPPFHRHISVGSLVSVKMTSVETSGVYCNLLCIWVLLISCCCDFARDPYLLMLMTTFPALSFTTVPRFSKATIPGSAKVCQNKIEMSCSCIHVNSFMFCTILRFCLDSLCGIYSSSSYSIVGWMGLKPTCFSGFWQPISLSGTWKNDLVAWLSVREVLNAWATNQDVLENIEKRGIRANDGVSWSSVREIGFCCILNFWATDRSLRWEWGCEALEQTTDRLE